MEEYAQLRRTGNDSEAFGLLGNETPKPWGAGEFQLPDEIRNLRPVQTTDSKPPAVESRPSKPGKIDLMRGWGTADAPASTGDRAIANPVKDGVLEVRYDDPNLDRKLNGPWAYNTLKLTNVPPEVNLHNWIDDKGYFFWFKNGSDNEKPHHY